MKQLFPLVRFAVAALLLAITPFAHADDKSKKKPTPPPRHTVIGSVSSSSITIDTGLTTKTFQIDKHTKCYVSGKPVQVGELKQGMRVTVTPGFDGKVADAINASEAPKAVPAASPAPKK